MFWDGIRWVDERATARSPIPSTTERRLLAWLAALLITALAASLAVPVVLADLSPGSLSISGTALLDAHLVTIATASPAPPVARAPTPSLEVVNPPPASKAVVTPKRTPLVPPAPTKASTKARTQATSAPTTGFVKRVGGKLYLNGQPYKFDGFNIYQAVQAPCWGMGSYPLKVASDLTAIGSGQEMARVFAFQRTATKNGVRDWSYMDKALATFAAHHVRVIMALTDQWSAQPCTDSPTDRTLKWYQAGYKTTIEGASTYRRWVSQVVARYRDNPTVAIWQLVNEAFAPNADGSCSWLPATKALQAFANDMADLVKGIDSNHLVSLGALQGYCGGDTSSWATTQSGPNIDVMDYHDYGYATKPLGDPGPNGFTASRARATANDKVLIVGEMGIGFASLTIPTTAYRATLLHAKLGAQFAAGSAGELLWCWSGGYSAVPPRDMEITYHDPAIGLLAKY